MDKEFQMSAGGSSSSSNREYILHEKGEEMPR